MNLKLCFLSTQAFSVPTLERLCSQGRHEVHVVGIISAIAERAKVIGYMDYEPICKRLKLPYTKAHSFKLSDPNDLSFFESAKFDVILALGWNRLLPNDILRTTKFGAIGSHTSPNALPFGRGRSPIVWAIALGFRKVTSQLLQLDAGVDTGRVLTAIDLPINREDTTQRMYYKIAASHALMLEKALTNISTGCSLAPSGLPDLELPKRGAANAIINWTLSAESIHDLVRAVSPPFHGAYFRRNNIEHRLFKATVWDGPFLGGKPGEIMLIFPDGVVVVATGQGHLLMLDHDCPNLTVGDKFL